jgi:tetratricopeptide (TPR) repeat protein
VTTLSNQADQKLKDFDELREAMLDKIAADQKSESLTRYFLLDFGFAKNESLAAFNSTTDESKAGYSKSALMHYENLLAAVDSINTKELYSFIQKLNLRAEDWDVETADDRVFMKAWIYQDIGFIKKRLGNIQDAIAAVEKGIDINPKAWSLIYNLACYQTILNDLEGAKTTMERCISSAYSRKLAGWALDDPDLKALITSDVELKADLEKLTVSL